jgi:glucose dehydrogenase
MLRPTFVLLIAAASLSAQVSFDTLVHAANAPQDWLSYSGTYLSQRYSPLDQITPANVGTLEQKIRSYAAGGRRHPVHRSSAQRYRCA